MRKYIKLLESNTSPEIIGFEKGKVILMNPDGEKVTVDIEIDDYGDKVDDYVREVSLIGDDGKYIYFFSGTQVDGDNEAEDIELQDWNTIEAFEEEERKRQEATRIRQEEYAEKERLRQEEEEKQRVSAKLTQEQWNVQKQFNLIRGNENDETPENGGHYVVLHINTIRYNYEDRLEESWDSYILVKISNEKDENRDLLSQVGFTDTYSQEEMAIIKSHIKKFDKLKEIIELNDPKISKYLKWIMKIKNNSYLTRLFELIDEAYP